MTKKLKRKTFQYVEQEVYDVEDTLKELKLLEYEIMHQTSKQEDDGVMAGKNSVRSFKSDTEDKATALIDDARLQRLRSVTDAIIGTYESLIDEKQKVIKLYYWSRPGELTWEGVAQQTNTSRATALRWRKQFIHEIARKLGEK